MLDEAAASLLYHIMREGSLLKASKIVGIPYSRAWERIARIERILGVNIVERRRGGSRGGGATLTINGRRLLKYYATAYRRGMGKPFTPITSMGTSGLEPGIVVSGSHDFLLATSIGRLREEGFNIELYWTGSIGGLSGLVLGESDIVGLHILDPQANTYNIGIYRSLSLHDIAFLLRGYDREQGFMTRTPMNHYEILSGLLEGRLVLANRRPGSGTRILLDNLLREYADSLGVPQDTMSSRVKGYHSNYPTHIDVAEAVSKGEADVGLGIRHAASIYNLNFTPLRWEHYDFLVSRDFYDRRRGESFMEELFRVIRGRVGELSGYRIPRDMGSLVTG